MNTYTIYLNGEKLNDYIEGRIDGIIFVMTGMPEQGYAHYYNRDTGIRFCFDATEVQLVAIKEAIDKCYSGVIDYRIV